ncbi:MAG: Gfo/Idh/MocA family protein [Acidimicrobiales bacterium]
MSITEVGKVGIAVVGGGFAGRVHALAARQAGARIVGVTASNPESSRAAAAVFGAERSFSNLTALIEHEDVDVVHVCTPNGTHREIVEMALSRGKHVVCEKPLATNAADSLHLSELAKGSGLRAAVAFAYRYHPMARRARTMVHEGALGALHLLHGSYLQDWLLAPTAANWRTLAAVGGPSRAFADIGSHWCDLAEWISGCRITDLTALTSTVYDKRPSPFTDGSRPSTPSGDFVPVDTEDIACLLFRATGGVVGTLTVSQVSAGRKNRLWLQADGGDSSVAFDQENPEWLWIGTRQLNELVPRDGSDEAGAAFGASALPPGHGRGFVESFTDLFGEVYRSIGSHDPVAYPTFDDGLRSTRITEAVLRSASTKDWVSVE